jgi:hypothetical protein
MDEQEFLHQLSVDSNINIELLKDLFHNDNFWALVNAGKSMDAIILIRSIQPIVGLREAQMIVQAFSKEKKNII